MPARGVAPGAILSEELDARGWTQQDLADIIGRPPQVISEIINGKKRITPETALELAQAFGTSAEFWINLEADYQLWLANRGVCRDKARDIARKSSIYGLAPVRELIKRGWIRPTTSADDLEREVLTFLRVSSPDEFPRLAVSYRASKTRGPEARAQVAWVRRVEALASIQPVGTFDKGRLLASIPSLLALSADVSHVRRVPQELAALGVHFVLVPHLPRTHLDGAAFYLEGQPVVALTLRHKRIDAFWFTLMHEIAHIAMGHPAVYLDNLEMDAASREDSEWEADRQARDWLLDPEAFEAFVERTQPRFSRQRIIAFAASQRRHPGIVLGRLQHDRLVEWRCLRDLLAPVCNYLRDWIDTPGEVAGASLGGQSASREEGAA